MSSDNHIFNYRRNKLIPKIVLFVVAILLGNAVFWYVFDVPDLVTPALLTIPLVLITRLIPPTTKTINLRANLLVFALFLVICYGAVITYHTSLIILFWIFLLPIGTLIFINKKSFIFWSSLLLVFIFSLPILGNNFPIQVTFSSDSKHLIEFVQLICIILTFSALLYMYRELLYSSLESLNKKQERLSSTSKKLRQTQREKDQFFANMSHEIRTPLNAIKGISVLLDSQNEEENQLIEHLRNTTDHLVNVVNDLIDFSKMEEGRLSINNKTFNFRETINTAFNTLLVAARNKDIAYKLSIDESIPENLFGDPHRIIQVLLNILSNSLKYTPNGNEVCLECSLVKEITQANSVEILLKISDTGMGISDEDLPNIFKDYYRSDKIVRQNITGTGLGLHITKHLIEAMNGQINIQSEVNKGTVVSMNLELATAQNDAVLNEDEFAALQELKHPLNILVVDDNFLNLFVAKKQLEKVLPYGSKLYSAKDGEIALKVFKSNDIDLILMDMEMPVMNGILATEAIRKMNNPEKSNVPIIALTANVGKNDIKSCLQSGMNAVVSKPFKLPTVMSHILNLIKSNPERKLSYLVDRYKKTV